MNANACPREYEMLRRLLPPQWLLIHTGNGYRLTSPTGKMTRGDLSRKAVLSALRLAVDGNVPHKEHGMRLAVDGTP